MAIAPHIKEIMNSKDASVIRKMFEEGALLKKQFGEDKVYDFDYEDFIINNRGVNIYISEGYKMSCSDDSILLSKGRTKGNISGDVKKKPVEEWLNVYKSN